MAKNSVAATSLGIVVSALFGGCAGSATKANKPAVAKDDFPKRILVHVVSDRHGKVYIAKTIETSGRAEMDRKIEDFAIGHWKGPPNSSTDIPFVISIKP